MLRGCRIIVAEKGAVGLLLVAEGSTALLGFQHKAFVEPQKHLFVVNYDFLHVSFCQVLREAKIAGRLGLWMLDYDAGTALQGLLWLCYLV